MPRYKLRTLLILLAVLPPVLAYVGSYYVLSRRGFHEADKYGLHGFYFVTPQKNDGSSQAHAYYTRIYWPLIKLDLLLGTGRHPGSEPMWAD